MEDEFQGTKFKSIPMIQRIIRGYGNLLLSALKIILLVLFCVLCGAILVLPLWKLAVTHPDIYTILVGFCVVCAIVLVIAKKVKTNMTKANNEKNKKLHSAMLVSIAKIFVCTAGVASTVMCVLSYKNIGAVISILVTLVLYGILAFGIKKDGQ